MGQARINLALAINDGYINLEEHSPVVAARMIVELEVFSCVN